MIALLAYLLGRRSGERRARESRPPPEATTMPKIVAFVVAIFVVTMTVWGTWGNAPNFDDRPTCASVDWKQACKNP
jgi:hypothetical protein